MAVVPLKAFAAAKSRLAARLGDAAREDLAASLFRRALDACAHAPTVRETIAVTGDDAALEVARAADCVTLREREPGLPAALALADEELERVGAESSLIVVADLPLVTAADLERVCAAAPPGPCVVVVPSVDGGTGALFRRPATVIAPAFGPGSAGAHLAAARAAGVTVVELDVPNLAADLDTPEQLESLLAAGLLERVPPA